MIQHQNKQESKLTKDRPTLVSFRGQNLFYTTQSLQFTSQTYVKMVSQLSQIYKLTNYVWVTSLLLKTR